ncbi:hypothetical protein GDO81_014642 [Engystomops pustulosus]|uniref:Uncharacterized protein n=1 Tax=Engystomops pustulosus TaxID=76066 RepID=A0AAV7BBU6_ENGPU|nr:hypothetical protein GDO81_014642 [Engystomops pustulosus]KAG8570010.1 hypothetical protein GDO81_014642 [Engystomops pustulosus]
MSPITALILSSGKSCYEVAEKSCCDACLNTCPKNNRFCGSDCVAYCICKYKGLRIGSGNLCLGGK